MLKTRIIPTLLFKDHGLVKGVGFDSWRRVGTALPAIKVYNTRQVDELIFLDITATNQQRAIDFAEIDRLADECFMPLTVGGGVKSIEDFSKLLRAGADKVSINSAALSNPELITQAAKKFGAQCVVVAIDAKKNQKQQYEVFTHAGTRATGILAKDWAKKVSELGAGEILLTAIERDGAMQGYDLELIKQVTDQVAIPVIASGGASCYEDMARALLEANASAVAAASIFHFTQQTPMEAKQYLKTKGIAVRL